MSSAEFAMTGAILVLGGSGLFLALAPRPGRPESWWLSTEAKALLVAALILGLVVIGVILLARGFLG